MALTQSNVVVEDIQESTDNISAPVNLKTSKWQTVKAANAQILSRASQGEIKLNSIINELQRITIAEEAKVNKDDEISAATVWGRIQLFRRRIANFLQQPKFHYLVILLVITDLIIVLIDLVLGMFPRENSIKFYISFSTIIIPLFK